MILRSHRDGNEGAIFSTDQGRREREAHGRGRASKQAREKKGGRDGRKSLFLCVAAVGGSELRQGRGDETRGRIRDPQQNQAAGETHLRWDATRTTGLNTNQGRVWLRYTSGFYV